MAAGWKNRDLESSSCEETYGFMPCTTSALGNLFLLATYGYLMYLAAKFMSNRREELLTVTGPGIIGGLFLPVVGAFAKAALSRIEASSLLMEVTLRRYMVSSKSSTQSYQAARSLLVLAGAGTSRRSWPFKERRVICQSASRGRQIQCAGKRCLRCGKNYTENSPEACSFHGHMNGDRGLFSLAPPHQGIDGEWTDESGVIVYKWNDKRNRPNTGRSNWKKRWSCCGEYDENANPCRRGRHVSYDDGGTLF